MSTRIRQRVCGGLLAAVVAGTGWLVFAQAEAHHLDAERIAAAAGTKATAKDDTIPGAGLVGLWTKADAQTSFDGFQVRDLGK